MRTGFTTTTAVNATTTSTVVPQFFSNQLISIPRCLWYSSKISKCGTKEKPSFTVSILGPPNAGKSTLYNRMQCKERNKTYRLGSSRGGKGEKGGKRKAGIKGRISSNRISKGEAIVSPIPGTTRDRRECWGRIGGIEFILMDTAGIDGDRIQSMSSKSEKHSIERSMMKQTMEAARLSDLVLLLWDARLGVTQDLMITARCLRKVGKLSKVVVVANKLEGHLSTLHKDSSVLENLEDVLRLGLGNAIPISALQGDGLSDIAILIDKRKKEKIQDCTDPNKVQEHSDDILRNIKDDKDSKPLQIAVIGRQNVGKSSLVNSLVDHNRVLTGSTPGLTRDAIAVEWYWKDKLVQVVDTAGIRKLTKRIDDPIEDMAVADALRAMKVAEVAVLVLDAKELYIKRQELAFCNAVLNEGRALVIAANKMDLLEISSENSVRDFADAVREQIQTRIPLLRNVPVVPISCYDGRGVSELMPTVLDARNRWSQTISTGLLNRWLGEVVTGTQPPHVDGVRAKLKYIFQVKGRPPTFIVYSNVSKIPEPYVRYLTKHFQDSFKFFGMPVRLVVKKSSKTSPYACKENKRGGFGLGGKGARFKRRVNEFKTRRSRSKKRDFHTSSYIFRV